MSPQRRTVRAWHVLTSVLALGAAACAGILGIEDRQLDTSDGGTQQDGGTRDGPSTGDGPATGDGPSQSETGNGDAGCGGNGPCVVASGLNHPFFLASDSMNVYWTEFGDDLGSANGSVKGCPLAGCGSGPTVYAAALTNPRGIVSDGTNVYFGTATFSPVNGAIWSCPVAGCAGNPTKLSGADTPWGLAVDSSNVYWADFDDSTVHRVPKGGGSGTLLFDGGSGVVNEGEAIAFDTSFLYFTDHNGDVFKLPIGGGDPALMAMWSVGGGWPVKVDSTSVYYGQPGGVSVMSKNATAGGPFVVDNLQDPVGIALDSLAGRLYWADYGTGIGNDGTIGRIGMDGGGRFLIASSLPNVQDVTLGGSYVFWLSIGTENDDAGNALPSTGELLRMAK